MKRVLIVPERVVAGGVGACLLERADIRVRAASSGEDALSIASVWPPALLIASNAVDDLEYGELAARVRSLVEGVSILMLTELATPTTGLSVDANLVEPFDEGDLMEVVAELLDIGVRSRDRVFANIVGKLTGLEAADVIVNILDLSESGALIEAPDVLQPGEAGDVEFYLPGESDLVRTAFIVRASRDDLQLHYGVEFFAMTDEDGERIRRFIDGRLGNLKET